MKGKYILPLLLDQLLHERMTLSMMLQGNELGIWLMVRQLTPLRLLALERFQHLLIPIHKSGGKVHALVNIVPYHHKWNGVKACYQNLHGSLMLG